MDIEDGVTKDINQMNSWEVIVKNGSEGKHTSMLGTPDAMRR